MTSTPLRGPEVPLTVECPGCKCSCPSSLLALCHYCGEGPYCPTCIKLHEDQGAPCFPTWLTGQRLELGD
jgi:hypothetical protein